MTHLDAVDKCNLGHYWTPEGRLVCYHDPNWLQDENYAPWEDPSHIVSDKEIREAFAKAVKKGMMADVDYGFLLSGGMDLAIDAHDLIPLWRKEMGDNCHIPPYTVGMENLPNIMAAKAVVNAMGGDNQIEHHVQTFTPDEVFDLIPNIVYHTKSYKANLIRSAISNWLLAERAAVDIKMAITGEGSDEIFAGYLYFKDAGLLAMLQNELTQIYGIISTFILLTE